MFGVVQDLLVSDVMRIYALVSRSICGCHSRKASLGLTLPFCGEYVLVSPVSLAFFMTINSPSTPRNRYLLDQGRRNQAREEISFVCG